MLALLVGVRSSKGLVLSVTNALENHFTEESREYDVFFFRHVWQNKKHILEITTGLLHQKNGIWLESLDSWTDSSKRWTRSGLFLTYPGTQAYATAKFSQKKCAVSEFQTPKFFQQKKTKKQFKNAFADRGARTPDPGHIRPML